MTDTEAIASRLHKFIQAAKSKASASGRLHKFIQMAPAASARSTKRKAEILITLGRPPRPCASWRVLATTAGSERSQGHLHTRCGPLPDPGSIIVSHCGSG